MHQELPSRGHLLRAAILFEGGLGVVAIGVGWLVGVRPERFVSLAWNDIGWGLVGTLPMIALMLACVKVPIRPLEELTRLVDELLVPLFRRCSLLELATIAALAGWGEELLFRGLIQAGITDWLGGSLGLWVGLGVASLLFGAAHALSPTYAVLAFLMGLYLGWLWIDTQNLLVPMVTHGAYDFLTLIYLVKWRRPCCSVPSPPRGRGS